MSGKIRFTPEEKEQDVIDYFDRNKSRTKICAELCISSRVIWHWAAIYNRHGMTDFARKSRNSPYSSEFKMKVVGVYIRDEGSSIDLGIK